MDAATPMTEFPERRRRNQPSIVELANEDGLQVDREKKDETIELHMFLVFDIMS